ncbi:amino acid-binding protein [Bacteroidia bacterium]|nr:amino acid-binding protein [Bacteroidia bacterium]GHV23320.1 amino acid-binding protein [Bacteroidia bacterium]
MLIKQLSIFLENKKGRFTEIAKILGAAGINMTAFTVAENSDFGILRLLVSDPEKARDILKEYRYAVTMTDVVCLQCPDEPGALGKAMEIITEAGIFIEYMYAFTSGKGALVVLRPDNLEKCVDVLSKNKLVLLAASEFYKL